mmetsp:Transcript_12466/g.15797  ORF Transcript_12466/g.15797 Transcript_12466/m.15797 type:complete len:342 (-) Transcript_12466:535-1560(-)|eukprot:CAMPEP_0203646106 /NCGR_PEP_ID=MMETSP0088-20131115/12404_1 /ASSEMBLY_ACC=CAM_ASM_001087 /TAXON_ID=426623 /ORGANISM="Chaetoceros affinis, Strain CCMP159" /LENGTH=341 /DNA_ID=CAMNT_0050503231 /DNA_START=41 /DNA_END=1066 /DNA_ORIENTATION=+
MSLLQDIAAVVGVLITAGLIVLATRGMKRSEGKNIIAHVIYVAITVALFFLPLEAKDALFTPFSVVVVGTAYPIYESLRAVCTIDEADDTTWLTYWIAQGIVSFSTEWVDGLGENVSTHWNMFEFLFFLWLLLPFTDGAAFLFNFIFGPIIAPLIQPIVQKADGWINKIISMVTNATHLLFVWFAFALLPAALKRAIWIILATLYPMGSSIISVTTPEVADDTFWLTYWSCFGCLFIIIDFIENFIGSFPGFYTLAIFVTIYLMLPLFRGAEHVFRNILVPLAGLQELLVRKDADLVRKQALADLPPERRALVMKEIADSFANSSKGLETPASPTGYNSIV